MQKFETLCWVPAPIDEVWTYFSNPRNLSALIPPLYRPEVESEPNLKDGATSVITLRPWFYPTGLRWVAKFHEVEAQGNERKFVDVQAAGPFAHWRHQHIFRAGVAEIEGSDKKKIQAGHGGTWIVDKIEYDMRFGALGMVADKLFGFQQLQSLFDFRHAELLKIFPGES